MKNKNRLTLSPARRMLIHIALIGLSLPFIMPLLWMIATSLKTDAELYASSGSLSASTSLKALLPETVHWQNYPDALKAAPFATYLRNTLFLCAVNVSSAVMSSAIVAYGFARLRFPGKSLLFMLMISTMALPGQVTMVPVFAIYSSLGWYGTFMPLIFGSFFGVPFYIFLLTQFFRTLPEELAEAARIDGASEFTIFWRVALPLAKPALATCALFQFLHSWNDFFGPLLYLNDPNRYTLAYGLQQFLSSYGGRWAQLMAGATLFTLPIILLFFLAQKTFIQGIATTGSKG